MNPPHPKNTESVGVFGCGAFLGGADRFCISFLATLTDNSPINKYVPVLDSHHVLDIKQIFYTHYLVLCGFKHQRGKRMDVCGHGGVCGPEMKICQAPGKNQEGCSSWGGLTSQFKSELAMTEADRQRACIGSKSLFRWEQGSW